MMEIVSLNELTETQREAAAHICVRALAPWPSAYQTLKEARHDLNG